MRLLTASLLLSIAGAHYAASASGELRPPPMGGTVTIRVMRGGSVDITLKAFEGRGNPLQYELTVDPRHGRLENFRQADRNRQGFASVTYLHGDDEESKSDEFAFRARATVGGGVSSPIKVKLQIVDALPRLTVAPAAADFSAVAGETESQQIILANEGGGRINGRIEPSAPFRVEGEGYFSLGRRKMTNITIRFSPESVEPVAPQKISPARADPGATLTLRGEAHPPFAVSAGEMVVQPDGSRSGTISITNISAAPLQVEIKAEPDNIASLPLSAEVAVGATAGVPMVVAAEKKGKELELKVLIRHPHFAQDLHIAVPAVPPMLHLLTPELDFREHAESFLEIRNSGGTKGRFSVDLPEGIRCLEGAQSFPVSPAETKRVRLLLSDEGLRPSEMAVNLDAGRKVKVAILLPAPPPVVALPSSPTGTSPPPMPWELDKDVVVTTRSDGSFVLSWIRAKQEWFDAQLWTVDGKQPRRYLASMPGEGSGPRTEALSFLPGLPTWCMDLPTRLCKIGLFFGGRGKLPDALEQQNAETGDGGADHSVPWSEAVVAKDMQNSSHIWRIVAARGPDKPAEAVSPDFSIDFGKMALVPVAPEPPPPLPPAQSDLVPVRTIGSRIEEDACTVALALPRAFGPGECRILRVTGLREKPEGRGMIYESVKLPPNRARLLPELPVEWRKPVEDLLREIPDHDRPRIVAVRFEDLGRGSSMLCQLELDRAETGDQASEPFRVDGPPARPFPLNAVLVAAALAILLWLAKQKTKKRSAW